MYRKPVDTNSATVLPLPLDAWLMFRFDNHEIIRLDLNPGESIENHTIDWRIIFYILEGEGILNVEGTEHQLMANQAIAVEQEIERYWQNTGEVILKLLVIKTIA